MLTERRNRDNVSYKNMSLNGIQTYYFTFFNLFIVQFEEKKYLETARKTIQTSVGNAGQKLDNEQMMNYAQNAGLSNDRDKK